MKIYKLDFDRIHLGNNSLADAKHYIHADTLFSALCIEALSINKLDEFVQLTRENKIHFTDAMPYIGLNYYLPKPILKPQKVDTEEIEGDSNAKKAFKNLKYIPSNDFEKFVKGGFTSDDALATVNGFNLGTSSLITKVSLRNNTEDARPYHVGVFSFEKDAGLYVIAKENKLFEELLIRLQTTGIGGKKSAGLGKFELEIINEVPNELSYLIENKDADVYITLSCALPKEEELEEVLSEKMTSYVLMKRSGFVDSATYSDSYVRKRDLYVFSAGSVFGQKFEGDIYDVSNQGCHPVYKYAKPFFIGVRL